MLVTLLVLSLTAQLAAAGVAFFLAGSMGRKKTWAVVGVALLLMSARRLISLIDAFELLAPATGTAIAAEVLALATSVLLLVGVILAGRTLRRAQSKVLEAVTERDSFEVREREQRRLIETIPAGIAVVTEKGIAFANRAFSELVDMEPTAIVGQGLESFADPEQTGEFRNWMLRATDAGVTGSASWCFRGGGTGSRWVTARAREIDWDGGRALLVAFEDITESHHATEELRDSEAKFRALTESAASAIFIFQGEQMVYVNARAEEISGYSREELFGMKFWEVIHPDFRELARSRGLARLHGEEVPSRYQLKLLRPDGGERWVDFTAALVNFHGDPIVIGTAFDVTELRSAEDELRSHRARLEELVRERTDRLATSEETFRALAENSYDTIMRFDSEHRHLYANPIVEIQTGIPVADFIGRTHAELGFPEHLVELWDDAIGRVFEQGKPHRAEFELPTGIWIDWLLIPEFAPSGEVASVITTARDITERKRSENELRRHRDHLEDLVQARTQELEERAHQLRQEIADRRKAEEALRDSEERFRSLHESVAIGLYRTTPDGRVLMANPAMVRMLGFTSFAELAACNLEEEEALYGHLPRRSFVELIEQTGAVRGLEWELTRRDGTTIHVRETASATYDVEGRVLYYEGALEDVTEQRRLEQELRQAQKMQAVGQLAGGVAHDFNNLLMAIMGPVELLQQRLQDDPQAVRDLQIVHDSARRAADLTRGLLAFASRQVLAARPLDLDEVIAGMMPILKRVMPENIGIEFKPSQRLAAVTADRAQLEQVVMNLCLNSRDAMPDGGTILISTRELDTDSRLRTRHGDGVRDAYVLLSIGDTGLGMDGETLQRVFEPFFSTKGPGRGAGMGLATVYGIVRQHDGLIEIDSSATRGTVCRVYLPACDAVVEPQPAVGLSPSEGGSETILVAEDAVEVRHVLVSILTGLGYRVLEAGDGVEALRVLQDRGGEVSLVITDVVMPRMGGADLYREAVTVAPACRFLFSSGYAESALEEGLVDGERTHFIAKPYGVDDLASVVRQILDGP